MRRFISIVILAAVTSVGAAEKPNFIFVLSDDQDWTETSVQMHPDYPHSKSAYIETPNLEKLAAQGMTFSAAYAPAPVCSPPASASRPEKAGPAKLYQGRTGYDGTP